MSTWINKRGGVRSSAVAAVIVMAVVAIVVRFAPDVGGGWQDLVAIGELGAGQRDQGIRRWVKLPGQRPAIITVLKPSGGMHNRIWELSVRRASTDSIKEDQRVSWRFMDPPPDSFVSEQQLALIHTLQSVDDFAESMTAPGFWYRVTPGGLEVLVQQAANGWNHDFGFEEGYYIWSPGDTWRLSDRWGTKGLPARYDRAKTEVTASSSER